MRKKYAPNQFALFTDAKLARFHRIGLSALTLFILLLCLAITVEHSRFSVLFIGLLSAAWAVTQYLWLRKYSAHFTQKIDKLTTTGRRYQNIAKYFESIMQDSTDIIFTVDTEGLILKFNRGAELHFAYTQAEIVGKPFDMLFINVSDYRKVTDAVLQFGKSTNEEIPMKTSQGEIIHLNFSISEMKEEAGQIKGLVITAKDITEKKKLEFELLKKNELLEKLAITDSLTELYNSRHFYDQIRRELGRLKRNPGRTLSLILLDVDHFKEYNDTMGHQRGDQVLRSLAMVIKACIRKDIDAGFRYGGDEFVVLLPETDQASSIVVAERIQKQFSSFKFGSTSISIGIAEAVDGEDDTDLVKRADEAMYASKKGGRARITLAKPS